MRRLFALRPAAWLAIIFAGAAAVAPTPLRAHGDDYSAGEPGNPKRPSRTVTIVMREADGKMIYVPDRVAIRKGEQIRFVLVNEGELDHEFLLATREENLKHAEEMRKNPDMEHDEPNGKRVAPKKRSELLWRFTKPGNFEYGCLIPGHREGGMIGLISVK